MYTGKLVRLRAYSREDAPLLLQYLGDPEIQRLVTLGVPFPPTQGDVQKFLDGVSSGKDAYHFAIETISESRFIGGCSVKRVDWKNSLAEIAIFIGDKGLWGKGCGTDANRLLVDFIFEQMNLNKVTLEVFAFNQRAIKSYVRCGFREEGVLRQELFCDGKYHDIVRMGLLRGEWLGMQEKI